MTPGQSVGVVLGIPIDAVTMAGAVDRIEELAERGRATGRSHQVATVNVDFVVNAIGDRSLFELLQRTDLSLADGMPIVWAARTLGCPIPERVAGADLVPALAARAAERGLRLYLLGGREGVAASAAEALRRAHPTLLVTADPGPDEVDVTAPIPGLAERIAAVDPDICCVAFGNPKQERWIERWGQELGIPVLIGVGGTLDFLAGQRRRAPAWSQRIGGEWIHRILTEPRRLAGRYARDIVVFGPRLMASLWRFRLRRGPRHTIGGPVQGGSGSIVLTVQRGDELGDAATRAVARAAESSLPLSLVVEGERRIDGRLLAAIVQLLRMAHWHDVDVTVDVAAPVQRQLASVGVLGAEIRSKRT